MHARILVRFRYQGEIYQMNKQAHVKTRRVVLTPEQQARVDADVAAVMARVMGTAPKKVRKKLGDDRHKSTYKATTPRVPPRPKPVYNYDEILALYRQGQPVREIVKTTGAHRATISRILTAAGVDPKERVGGPTRKDRCRRGHSMADAYELKNGGRSCKTCKKARDQRVAQEKKLKA